VVPASYKCREEKKVIITIGQWYKPIKKYILSADKKIFISLKMGFALK